MPRFGIGMIQAHHAWIYTWCHLRFMSSYSAMADDISTVQPLWKVREYFCNIVITMNDHVSIPTYTYTWAFSIPSTNLALNHQNMLCSVLEAPTHIITFGISSQSRYFTHIENCCSCASDQFAGKYKMNRQLTINSLQAICISECWLIFSQDNDRSCRMQVTYVRLVYIPYAWKCLRDIFANCQLDQNVAFILRMCTWLLYYTYSICICINVYIIW